jgi:hypothetical protein
MIATPLPHKRLASTRDEEEIRFATAAEVAYEIVLINKFENSYLGSSLFEKANGR